MDRNRHMFNKNRCDRVKAPSGNTSGRVEYDTLFNRGPLSDSLPFSSRTGLEMQIYLKEEIKDDILQLLKKMFFFFQVAEIQSLSSRLEVQNIHVTSDLQQCERTRTEAAAEAAQQLQLKQKTHDDQVDYICALMYV